MYRPKEIAVVVVVVVDVVVVVARMNECVLRVGNELLLLFPGSCIVFLILCVCMLLLLLQAPGFIKP